MNHKATQDNTHSCPGRCGRSVTRQKFACAECWHRLPRDYQNAILAAFLARDNEAHSRAMVDAMHWYHRDSTWGVHAEGAR